MTRSGSIAAVLAAALALSSCAAEPTETAESGRPQVYASFYAMYDFAREICGDRADAHNICPPGSEPHDFEPTAKEMARLSEADVFVYNGLGIESWAESVSETLRGVTVVKASEGLDADDPHIWLDPDLAAVELENIARGCAEADPGGAEYYLENCRAAKERLKRLSEDYFAALDGLERRTIVVSHDAYSNLCAAFGLTQYPINGSDNEEEPTPRRMAEIEDFITDNNIRYIFTEPLGADTTVKAIAADTGCGLLSLDPFEGNLDGEDYFTVMYRNLEAVREALEV